MALSSFRFWEKINEISQAYICFHSQDGLFKVMPLGETNAISFLKKKIKKKKRGCHLGMSEILKRQGDLNSD